MWSLPVRTRFFAASLLFVSTIFANLTPNVTSRCQGYAAANVQKHDSGLSADLNLIGGGCAIYGPDLALLKLTVNYDTSEFPSPGLCQAWPTGC